MIKSRRRRQREEAELDITSFMNLMIILVPVLLMNMVFSTVTVLNINLPSGLAAAHDDKQAPKELELVIREEGMGLYYPAGVLVRKIPKTSDDGQDFAMLSDILKEVKRQFSEKSIEHRTITILSEPGIDYQTIVTAMDKTRSYKAVVAASLVDAELFPEISLGDAPTLTKALKTASVSVISEKKRG